MSSDVDGQRVAVRNPYEFLLLPSWRSDSAEARRAQALSEYTNIRGAWRTFGFIGLLLGGFQALTHMIPGGYAAFFALCMAGAGELGAFVQIAVVRRRRRLGVRQHKPFSISRVKD